MIPLLFNADASNFDVKGIPLSDCISCTVTEELNGVFELSMEYPKDGYYADKIKMRNIIWAIPSPYRKEQAFRIYEISKSINDNIKINARHISYDLNYVQQTPNTGVIGTVGLMFYNIKSESVPRDDEWYDPVQEENRPINHIAKLFNFYSDITEEGRCLWSYPESARNILGGIENSILDVWHGEYTFDNYDVYYNYRRGKDRKFTIRYAFNMTDCDVEFSDDSRVTGVVPFWKGTVEGSEQEEIVIPRGEDGYPIAIYANGTTSNDYILSLDVSSDFQDKPTVDDVINKAKYYMSHYTDKDTSVSLSASYATLNKTIDYMDLPVDEECDLGDKINVECDNLNVHATARIKRIETDVLLERYNNVEIGTLKTSLTDTLRQVIYGY